ncbi:MAG: YggU family protein [Bdellovibrionales bacterium]|nr:YggU family protein [Bdellovibrionales bacterium]
MSWIEAHAEGVLVRLLVQPKASRSEWVGLHGEGDGARMKLRVAAPPVDGEANAEVVRFVRKSLKSAGVRDARLVRGETAKQKDVLLTGATFAAVRAALAPFVSI